MNESSNKLLHMEEGITNLKKENRMLDLKLNTQEKIIRYAGGATSGGTILSLVVIAIVIVLLRRVLNILK